MSAYLQNMMKALQLLSHGVCPRPLWRCLSLLGLCLLLATPLRAADIPGFNRSVELGAREQPVGRFIEELFGQVGVPTRVDNAVRGTVNGDFDGPASKIFTDIAAAFHLMMYYDGAIAWVYPSKSVMSEFIPISASAKDAVMNSADSLGMIDASNRIVSSDVGMLVSGTSRFVEQVQELVQMVDQRPSSQSPAPAPQAETAEAVMRVFKLRYAWAGDVSIAIGDQQVQLPGVATLLRQLIEPGAVRGVADTVPLRSDGSLDGLRGEGLQATATSGSRSATSLADGGSTESTRIVADRLSNSVVVRDRADRMDEYAALIEALDIEPEMIEIEATIIDLNTDRLRELGVNWRLQGEDASALFGQGTSADLDLVPGGDITSQAQGGVVSLVLGDSVQFLSRIRALEAEGAARVVSKPHVMTLSNVEALLNTTSTFFVRVEGDEEVDLFDVSVGTTLRVTPHVFESRDGARIRLRVNIQDGSTTDQTVDQIPIVERSTINTQALVNEGESLLIGGLVREFDASGVSKVPVLGSLPVVGALFRNNVQSSQRLERMFLITPRVNLRSRQGLRYSVPVTSGFEADIIRSAPSRMDPTLAGIAARDDIWPLRQDLPPAGGEPSLVPDSQIRPRNLPPRPTAQQPRARTPQRSADATGANPAVPRQALPEPAWHDGWQEVSAPLSIQAPRPQVETFPTQAPAGSSAPAFSGGAASADGWQEVVR